MRGSKAHTPARRTYLAVLLGLSIVALLLPGKWTGKLISLVQVIVPFQDAATFATDSVAAVINADPGSVSRGAYEALEREKAALEHRTAALAIHVAELQEEVDLLTATRTRHVGEDSIGARGRLIPARIITEDLLGWRSSRLVSAGSLQGVRRGSAVTSRVFTIGRGAGIGVLDGMAVVLGEAFVGLVEQVGTHTARVKLLSDVSVQMKVRIGRFTHDEFVPLDRYFWLAGRGNGTMEIRDAGRRDVEAGEVQLGDTVLSGPGSGALPAAMTIGTITAIEPDRNNPLLSILTVQSAVSVTSLRRVYVFDPLPDSDVDATEP